MNSQPKDKRSWDSGLKAYVFYSVFAAVIAALSGYFCLSELDLSLMKSTLVGINVAALFCMGFDKALVGSLNLRIPETVLHILALAGGVPGILLGIHVFKHKTRKAAFQFTLLLIVGAQVALIRLAGLE